MDDGTWLTGLSGLSPEQIVFGITKCIDSGNAWPPTLPEFRLICFDLPKTNKIISMVLNKVDNPMAKEIRRRIGGFNIDTHCGGSWTMKYLQDQIKMEYEDMTENIKSLSKTKHLSDTNKFVVQSI